MRNFNFHLVILVFCMSVALFPQKGFAKLTALNETEMRDTTGQAGIALSVSEKTDLDREIGNIAFGNTDDTNFGIGTFIGINNLSLIEEIVNSDSVSISVTTEANPFDNTVNTGINVVMKDVTIDINRLDISSIPMEPTIGIGTFFGSLPVSDYHATISGNLRIWTH